MVLRNGSGNSLTEYGLVLAHAGLDQRALSLVLLRQAGEQLDHSEQQQQHVFGVGERRIYV